jgi:hypothetical protein
MKMSNAIGFSDYGDGFIPDEEISELDGEGLSIKQLGDIDELLLKTTIDRIFGRTRAMTKHIGNQTIFVGSAIDKTPARRNAIVNLRF